MVCVSIGSHKSRTDFTNFFSNAYAIIIFTLKVGKIDINLYPNIPFDVKFNAESEYQVRILIPPTHFGKKSILKICVGESPKIFSPLKSKFNSQSYDVHIAYI